jgi:hypothetical protein
VTIIWEGSSSLFRGFRGALVGAALAACAEPPPPVTGPSGDQSGYAENYPSRIGQILARSDAEEAEARETFGKFAAFPDSLRGTNFALVREALVKADESGKSGAYAEAALEAEGVERFFAEEKQPLRQKVAGSVAYVAKQKGCDEEIGGASAGAVERVVEKQLDERLRSRSEAARFLDEHAEEIGNASFAAVDTQASEVANASFIVYVRLELLRRELSSMLEEASSVRVTLDRVIEESDAAAKDPGASRAKKAVLERRLGAAKSARAAHDGQVGKASAALEKMEQRIDAVQNDYEKALADLLEELERRAQAPAQK